MKNKISKTNLSNEHLYIFELLLFFNSHNEQILVPVLFLFPVIWHRYGLTNMHKSLSALRLNSNVVVVGDATNTT